MTGSIGEKINPTSTQYADLPNHTSTVGMEKLTPWKIFMMSAYCSTAPPITLCVQTVGAGPSRTVWEADVPATTTGRSRLQRH
jgi:hypothetical protein